jgi:hypothetical protein
VAKVEFCAISFSAKEKENLIMAKVTFIKDYNWDPVEFGGRVTVYFAEGTSRTVTRECAEAAKKAGVLKEGKQDGEDGGKTE